MIFLFLLSSLFFKVCIRFDTGPSARRGPPSDGRDSALDGGVEGRKSWNRGDSPASRGSQDSKGGFRAGGNGGDAAWDRGADGRQPWNRGEAPASRGSQGAKRGFRTSGGEKPPNKELAQSLKVQEMLRAKKELMDVSNPCQ